MQYRIVQSYNEGITVSAMYALQMYYLSSESFQFPKSEPSHIASKQMSFIADPNTIEPPAAICQSKSDHCLTWGKANIYFVANCPRTLYMLQYNFKKVAHLYLCAWIQG